MSNELDLDKLEALEKAATPSPWELGTLLHDGDGALTFDHEHNIYPPDTYKSHGFQYGGPVAVVAARGEAEDAPFIHAFRNAATELIRRARRLDLIEKHRLCVVPPNQETPDWSVYAKFDGEFGYDNEIGTGATLAEALDIAAAAIADTEDVQ